LDQLLIKSIYVMKKSLLFLTVLGMVYALNAQVQITNTTNYVTRDQMLLANEINESGEPFAEALGYNLDDLDPMVKNSPDSISFTLGIENYEYSRYHLGTVISRSGIGLHMMWAPVIMEMAAMPPANPWPQFAEFKGGDPHLPQPIDANFPMDFSSLRWDRSKMDRTLNPGAMGQTLMKQYLWAQDMLGGFHDGQDDPVTPDGTVTPDSTGSPNFDPDNDVYYGGNNADGFIGQVLTAEAINKVKFLITQLAWNGSSLGMVDPVNYDPANGI
jgi:hypothetical protein